MPGQTADQNFDSFFDASFPTDMSGTMADLRRNLIEPGLRIASQHDVFVTITQKDWLSWVVQGLTNARTAQGRIRLLILTPSDTSKKSIENTIWTIRSELQRLVDQNLDSNAEQVQDLQSLGKLAQLRSIECKLAHASDIPDFGPVFGVMHDKEGDVLTYESRGDVNQDEVHLDIQSSCQDWEHCQRVESKFRDLWNGSKSEVSTTDISQKFNATVQVLTGRESSLYESEDDQKFDRSKLWPHQQVAFDRFLESKRGVLEMATGTGKTRTALAIGKSLAENQKIDQIIISTDGNDLLDQWYTDVLQCFRRTTQGKWDIHRHYRSHKPSLPPSTGSVLVCRRSELGNALRRSQKQKTHVLLIHDEVHGLGAPANVRNLDGLASHVEYRLGLSATPERTYDEDGNAFIEKNVGPVIYSYSLKEAIADGILCPFEYEYLEYEPSEEDRLRLQKVHQQKKARAEAGTPMSEAEVYIALARVHKTSKEKLAPFRQLIERRPDILERCIIFVEEKEYGEEVLEIVHRYRSDFHTYFDKDKPEVLQRFARGGLQSLITCHRLSEGIDIPDLKNIVLFASAKGKLETIQRMGRALRTTVSHPDKRARVVDFVRTQGDAKKLNSDQERKEWLLALSGYSEKCHD